MNATSDVTAFGAACAFTGVRDNDRDAWLAEREKYLTASDCAAVLGFDDRKSAFQVWLDKTAPQREPQVFGFKHPAFWGKLLEQPILTAIANHHGWRYRAGGALLASRAYPWLAATLDAEIDRGHGDEVLEGKTTSFMLRRDWDEVSQQAPRRVLVQVHHQLVVTGAQRAVVACLIGGNTPVLIEVEPHPDFHAMIVEESERFMAMVRERVEPPVSWQDEELIERLYPEKDGTIVQLGARELEWAKDLADLGKQRRDLERREKQVKAWLKRSIASATWGKLPESVNSCEWLKLGTEHHPAHHVEAFDTRVLRPIKHGPKYSGALPLALPVSVNEGPDGALPAGPDGPPLLPAPHDALEHTRLPPKRRRRARR